MVTPTAGWQEEGEEEAGAVCYNSMQGRDIAPTVHRTSSKTALPGKGRECRIMCNAFNKRKTKKKTKQKKGIIRAPPFTEKFKGKFVGYINNPLWIGVVFLKG